MTTLSLALQAARLKVAVWRYRLRRALSWILRIIRKRALLLTSRLTCWASEQLAGPEVRAKMRELEQAEPPTG